MTAPTWSVRREIVESQSPDGRISTRERWGAYVDGHRFGYYESEAEAEEIARDLAGDTLPACLVCGRDVETGAETHPGCVYDARPATDAERERIARIRGENLSPAGAAVAMDAGVRLPHGRPGGIRSYTAHEFDSRGGGSEGERERVRGGL